MLQQKKYLIVGANSQLSLRLMDNLPPENTFVLYHRLPGNKYNNINYFNESEFNKIPKIDVVFIISAFIPNTKIAYNYNQDLFNVNVEFVNKIVQHFKDSRLIFASSVSVYNNAGDVIKENSALNPSSSYAVSKLWGEIIVKQVNSYSIFRISSLIGKGVKGETFVPMIINQSIQKKSITLFGSGERKQNYINYSDVAQLFISAAHLNNNSTYLAVNPYSFSNIEVAEKVKSLFPAVNINYLGKDSTESFIYDGSKTFAELNFTPSISLTDSMLEIIK